MSYATKTVYVVDQQGATSAFDTQKEAEDFLVAEAWAGAVHLTITKGEAPAELQGYDLAEYAAANLARDPGCEQ